MFRSSSFLLVALAGPSVLAGGCIGGLELIPSTGDTSGGGDTEPGPGPDTEDTEDTDSSDVDITGISPYYGTTAGGTEVTIRGGPFDSSPVVLFDDEAAQVQTANTTALTVLTPVYGEEAAVDVTVTTDAGSVTAEQAFYYFQDGTGLLGSVGNFVWNEYGGNYWADDPEDFGSAYAWFISPMEYDAWKAYASAMDSCASDYTGSPTTVYVYDIGADSITLSVGSSHEVVLELHPQEGYYHDDELESGDFSRYGTYDLEQFDSSTFPEFSVDGFLFTPYEVDLNSPNIQGSTLEPLSRSDLNFTWDVEGPGDWLTLELYLMDQLQIDVEETITCVMSDDGQFSVPTSVWSNYPTGRVVLVALSRWQLPDGVIPFNNSTSGMAGVHRQYFGFQTR